LFQACEPAANLALQDVNAKTDLLPGYTLRLHWNDSGVRKLFCVLYFIDMPAGQKQKQQEEKWRRRI
jgi:hypothetical protein